MEPTERLATFVAATVFESLTSQVVQRAKWAVIDGLAVTLGGWPEIGPQVVAYLNAMGGKPVSTVAGAGIRTNAPLAAFANASMSHVLDFDDINENMGGHPTGPVLGAVLALGEMLGSSGRDCLLAYILGVETETKVGRALIKTLYGKGWHPTSVLGILGSAAACGKLLGLDSEKMTMAIGMAGSMAGGLKQNFGTLTKSLHVGQAAQHGLMAALLARDGWTAATDVLEGRFGFANLFCGPGSYDLAEMTGHLGNPWDIVEPGIKLKKYPCCGSIHPALDAVFTLIGNEALKPDNIGILECAVHPSKQHILIHPRPRTGLEAKFSLEYCLARAVIDGRISVSNFQDAATREESVQTLLPKISVSVDPDLPEWGSRVVAKTTEGREASVICDRLPGIESHEDLARKFNDCAAQVIGPERAKSVLDIILRLEKLADISELMRKLAQKA